MRNDGQFICTVAGGFRVVAGGVDDTLWEETTE
jgi:hypothetical protein